MRIRRRAMGRMRIRRRTRKSTIATAPSTRTGAIRATIARRRGGTGGGDDADATSYRRVGPPREASGSIGRDLSKDASEDLASASEGGDLDASTLRIWNLEMPDAPVIDRLLLATADPVAITHDDGSVHWQGSQV